MRFQDGDIVKIAKTSRFYGRSRNNPKDIEGRLEVNSHMIFEYKVNWGEGKRAWYNDKDLRLVRRPE